MLHAVRQIVDDVRRGENIDVYVIVLLATIFAALGIYGHVSTQVLSSAVLATLSVLAFSLLAIRKVLTGRLSEDGGLAVDRVLRDRRAFIPFADRLVNVRTIWLFGPTVINVLSPHITLLSELVRSGGELRVLVFDPDCSALSQLADLIHTPVEQVRTEIRAVVGMCHERIEGGASNIAVRTTTVMPGYSMVVLEPYSDRGQLIVEYLGYQASLFDRPHIVLGATRDHRWFRHYRDQYEAMWQRAETNGKAD